MSDLKEAIAPIMKEQNQKIVDLGEERITFVIEKDIPSDVSKIKEIGRAHV